MSCLNNLFIIIFSYSQSLNTIIIPFQQIIRNIISDGKSCPFIADDVVVVSPLPYGVTRWVAKFIGVFGYGGFV